MNQPRLTLVGPCPSCAVRRDRHWLWLLSGWALGIATVAALLEIARRCG